LREQTGGTDWRTGSNCVETECPCLQSTCGTLSVTRKNTHSCSALPLRTNKLLAAAAPGPEASVRPEQPSSRIGRYLWVFRNGPAGRCRPSVPEAASSLQRALLSFHLSRTSDLVTAPALVHRVHRGCNCDSRGRYRSRCYLSVLVQPLQTRALAAARCACTSDPNFVCFSRRQNGFDPYSSATSKYAGGTNAYFAPSVSCRFLLRRLARFSSPLATPSLARATQLAHLYRKSRIFFFSAACESFVARPPPPPPYSPAPLPRLPAPSTSTSTTAPRPLPVLLFLFPSSPTPIAGFVRLRMHAAAARPASVND